MKQKRSENRFVPILVQLRGNQNLPTILCFGQGLVAMAMWHLTASDGPRINVKEEVSVSLLLSVSLFILKYPLVPDHSSLSLISVLVQCLSLSLASSLLPYDSESLSLLLPLSSSPLHTYMLTLHCLSLSLSLSRAHTHTHTHTHTHRNVKADKYTVCL